MRQISGFEWDESKRESNLVKHGIDFVDAAGVFRGPVVEWEDVRWKYGERRIVAIGRLREFTLAVVYTVRADVYRLISARRARRDEEAAYRQVQSEEAPEPDGLGPGPDAD